MAEETTIEANEEARIYELAFLISPYVAEESAAALLSSIQDRVAKENGEIISSGEPKLRQLAYEVTHRVNGKKQTFDKGYFGWVKFAALPDASVKIGENTKTESDIMRSMLISTLREDTFVPRDISEPAFAFEESEESERKVARRERREDEDKGPADEEEIDKSIEELVIE